EHQELPSAPDVSVTCAAETDAVPAQHERERGDRGVRGPQKKVVIIAGPNGAGKTAFARAFLPKRVREGALGSGYPRQSSPTNGRRRRRWDNSRSSNRAGPCSRSRSR